MSNLKLFSTSLVAIALSLVTGCTTTPQQNQNTSEAPSGTTQPVQLTESPSPTAAPNNLSSSDRQFINEAAQGGLAEVQLGQLASQRAANNAVKQFGLRMVKDHTQVNTQLKQLAARKGVKLPTTLNGENQQLQQRLSKLSGANFDREYMTHMVQDHQKDVSAFQTEAQQGQDPDVKAFASQTLPTLEEHLQQARSIVNAGVNTGTSTSSPSPTNTP
ncbi:outer membrane protein [Anabaenopsis circularis NIES-21]|uniref:Outer membrane protein n=1 Tax=Anabaenopsis circularis NIES-21 TaxID=1085406 RepID=A0A1Z4GL70_9CYAN|nr:outer membrane protein [Anabaenopsis circularis NIES-21]